MKKVVCCVVCMLLMFTCVVTVSGASSSNVIFSSFTDSKITSTGVPSWANASNVSFENGILTIVTAGENTKANVYLNGSDLKVAGLRDDINSGTAKFTLHTEMKIPAYSTSTIIEAGLTLGSYQPDLNANTRFMLVDRGAERNTVPRNAHAKVVHNVGGTNHFASDSIAANIQFTAGEWVSLDVLVDESQETATFYVNNRLVESIKCTKAGLNAGGWKIGFRGYNGVSFRNFAVYNGLVVPQNQVPSATATTAASATPSATATASAGASATATAGTNNPTTSDSATPMIILGIVTLLGIGMFILLRYKRVHHAGE